jgi:hypothetical protein
VTEHVKKDTVTGFAPKQFVYHGKQQGSAAYQMADDKKANEEHGKSPVIYLAV